MDAKKPECRKFRYRGSLFGPLLLIALGVVFLLKNTGALTGDVWGMLLNLWPVLLIVWGLDSLLKREGVVGAFFLIGLGTVFLFSNLGYLGLNVWDVILRLWPLLLIAIGLDIALGRRSVWGAAVALIIFIPLLFGAVWLSGMRMDAGQPLSGERISQGLEGATRARVVLRPAVGALLLDSTPEPDGLIEGRVHKLSAERVSQQFSVTDGAAAFTLSGSGGANFPPSGGRGSEWSWDLSVTPTVPLEIETSMGAGKSVVDLRGLQVSRLDVSYGVGETVVFLPEQGRFEGKIAGAIGKITIWLPSGVGLQLIEEGAIISVDVPEGFDQQGGRYTSPGYEQSENRVQLKVNLAIGAIEVRYIGE